MIQSTAGAAATVTHIRIDEYLFDSFKFKNSLVELDVGCHTTGKHYGVQTGFLHPIFDIVRRYNFQDVLVCRGDINLWEI